jgi:hypothetical protein
VRGAADRRAQVFAQRADVGPFRTRDRHARDAAFVPEQPKRVDRDLARVSLDRFAATRQRVESLAADLHRTVHRRDLFDAPGKTRERGAEPRAGVRRNLRHAHGCARRIGRVRRAPEDERERVRLAPVFDERDQTRRLAERERQHARGHRIERSEVTDG